jgi:hypothetical protein
MIEGTSRLVTHILEAQIDLRTLFRLPPPLFSSADI